MLTYGNGDQIARLLHELQTMKYKDMEEQYYDSAINSKTEIKHPLPLLSTYLGRGMGLSGKSIRDRYDSAASSDLTSTRISDVK